MSEAPIPVSIAAPVPIPVRVSADDLAQLTPHLQSQLTDPSRPAVTTFQEDLTTAGQRQINLIWERTQSAIALMVAAFTMTTGIYSMWSDKPIPTIIAVAFGTVTGFYFSRTNHAAIGGIGPKPEAPYMGR